jgi:hypothetical protein
MPRIQQITPQLRKKIEALNNNFDIHGHYDPIIGLFDGTPKDRLNNAEKILKEWKIVKQKSISSLDPHAYLYNSTALSAVTSLAHREAQETKKTLNPDYYFSEDRRTELVIPTPACFLSEPILIKRFEFNFLATFLQAEERFYSLNPVLFDESFFTKKLLKSNGIDLLEEDIKLLSKVKLVNDININKFNTLKLTQHKPRPV